VRETAPNPATTFDRDYTASWYSRISPPSWSRRRTWSRPIRSYTRRIAGILERLKQWLGGATHDAELAAEGGEPVATGTGASIGEQPERETSTNAQVAGASDEPWPGNE
jgi:hypothetical protein